MSTIVHASALSHSPLLLLPEFADADGAHPFRDAVQVLAGDIASADPDTVVVIAPDHFRALHYDVLPAFCIGVGVVDTYGDWGLPARSLTVDRPLATALTGGLLAAGFDVAYSARLIIDHGAHQPLLLLGLEDRPVVPVIVNCAAPPLPSAARCLELGDAVARVLAADGLDRGVAMIGSGGLSHQVDYPHWSALDPADETYSTYVTGVAPADRPAIEARRATVLTGLARHAQGLVNPTVDEDLLALLAAGRTRDVADRLDGDLSADAGTGINEVRTWLSTYAASSGQRCEVLAYAPVPSWLCGMAAVRIDAGGG